MMSCPVCKNTPLESVALEQQMPAHKCPRCTGIWLMASEYRQWLKSQPPPPSDESMTEMPIPTWDVPTAKVCPNCGRLMVRYKVLPLGTLVLDRCGQCHGVWFDRAEWNVISSGKLSANVDQFFSQPWQTKIHEEEARASFEKIYRDRFGKDYAKVREVWDWLQSHPQRSLLLAYLQAEDPYKL
jgi:Zn-finger nucleic acid-binding protein